MEAEIAGRGDEMPKKEAFMILPETRCVLPLFCGTFCVFTECLCGTNVADEKDGLTWNHKPDIVNIPVIL